MKAPATPAPIVLLDSATAVPTNGQINGPVVDFGGQEVRFVLAVESTPDFQLVDPNQGPIGTNGTQSLTATAFPSGTNRQFVAPLSVSVPGGSSPTTDGLLTISQVNSVGLFVVQVGAFVSTRIQSGSFKVTLHFV